MKQYSGWNWLLIDAANSFGKDKDLFEQRIEWAEMNLGHLENLIPHAETPALFHKAVLAIRKAQKGLPMGHMVAVDATASGVQLMSCLTGCEIGARSTGLVDPNKRADAYTDCTEYMNEELAKQGLAVNVLRKDAKTALMCSFYGSKAQPKQIFGEDTPELEAFYVAAPRVAPGAWELRQDLLDAWQPYVLEHGWKLPDGFDARVKVMKKIDGDDSRSRIEVDELDHATFTYEYYINEGSKRGVSLVANVTHSSDGFVVREMHRRCNYDTQVHGNACDVIYAELHDRQVKWADETIELEDDELAAYNKVCYYRDLYAKSKMATVVILPYLTAKTVKLLADEHLDKLYSIVQDMNHFGRSPLITVHDAFAAHPNRVDAVRFHYKEILADIADSNMLNHILSQLYGMPAAFQKLGNDLGDKIRASEYGLC